MHLSPSLLFYNHVPYGFINGCICFCRCTHAHMTCAIEHSALMPLCSTVCSWMCVYVHLYKQRVCKGARACGEKAGVPEASQTAADWEGADRLPGVDLQSRSVSQVNKIWHVISPQNPFSNSEMFMRFSRLAPENDLHCNYQKASVCSLQGVLSPSAFSPMTVYLTRFPDLFSATMGADVSVPVCCSALPLSMATT